MRRNIWIIVALFLAAYGGFLTGEQKLKWTFRNWKPAVVFNADKPQNVAVDFSQFWEVWNKLYGQYVDKTVINPQKMMEGAISGMVASLGDPYTVFLPPQQNKEAKEDLGGEFDGVGIQLGFKDKMLAVMTPLDGTPAAKAGVKPGDIIVHIKDELKNIDKDTDGMTLPEAVNIIRGKKGTNVQLTLGREGVKDLIKVDLVRDTILVKSVTVEYPSASSGQVAVLKLTRFGDRTKDEWNKAVDEIVSKNSKKIVLDLRNNPGGYLDGAVYMAGEFLPVGRRVVVQVDGDGTKGDRVVTRNGRLLKQKLVVLINEGSASAAEILAGGLQDWKRAKLVGAKSFGKGSVQQPEDFDNGAGIHITIAKWLRPSGEWIDKKGIMPDIEEKDESKQLDRAIEAL